MVGHMPLEHGIGVRIPVPQLCAEEMRIEVCLSARLAKATAERVGRQGSVETLLARP